MEAISISPVSLFLEAGPVGRGVMIVLLAASVWCWVLILTISVSVMRLRKAAKAASRGETSGLTGLIFTEGRAAAEIVIAGETVAEMRARLQEAMNRAGRILVHHAEGGLPNLAVISSVAPFIGLFGTVWGIMTSFTGIAAAKDTSLAVVAPGIAEALAATAYGLAAAIPASIAYSRLGAALGATAGELGNLVEIESVRLMVATAPVPPPEETR